MAEWTVELTGDPDDLRNWVGELKPPFLPSVTLTDVSADRAVERKVHLLAAGEFSDCHDAAGVRDRAIPLLRKLNALMAISRDCGVVTLGHIYRRDEKGKYWGTALMSGTVQLRLLGFAHVTVLRNGRVVEEPPAPSFAQRALELGDAAAEDALEHYSRADNWHDLYKAYEALGNKRGLQRLGFSKAEVDNFSLTAQQIRHHEAPTKPPRALTLEEGREFIASAFRKRLSHRGERPRI